MFNTIKRLGCATVVMHGQKKASQNLNKKAKKRKYAKVPKIAQKNWGTMRNKKFINQYKNTVRGPITHSYFLDSLISEKPSSLA